MTRRAQMTPGSFIMLVAALLSATRVCRAQSDRGSPADPLPSWNEGAAKKAIIEFVTRVTTAGSPDFVPVNERIATFDNDGTLWCEKPVYVQYTFAFHRARVMADRDPSLMDKPAIRAIVADDREAMAKFGQMEIAIAPCHNACRDDTGSVQRHRQNLVDVPPSIRGLAGSTRIVSISRSSSCSLTCGQTASSCSSSPAPASIS